MHDSLSIIAVNGLPMQGVAGRQAHMTTVPQALSVLNLVSPACSSTDAPLANGAASKQQAANGSVVPVSPSAAGSDASTAAAQSSSSYEGLRREWEALLDQAAKCLDEDEQPTMLARVESMLPVCVEAGISVKYGRKVLQRLQALGPARRALRAALAAHDKAALEEALKACKSVRCLLDERLMHVSS